MIGRKFENKLPTVKSLAPLGPSQEHAQTEHAAVGQAEAALSCEEVDARQRRLLSFIDSCELRVQELLNEAVGAGLDPADYIALLSDGSVLPSYINLVPRSRVAPQVARLRLQVYEPLLHGEWDRPTPGVLLAIVLFEGVQAVSVYEYTIHNLWALA